MTSLKTGLVAVVLALLTLIPCQRAVAVGLAVEGGFFTDDTGANIILRGYNLQAKAPPFQVVQVAGDLDPLWQMGSNLLRFNFVWEAAEPLPGVYDEAYFDYYDRVINWAWERGMYVLIDFHNNAFSRFAAKGCGSGFPAWAVSPRAKLYEPASNGSCVFSTSMMQAMLSQDNYTNWQDFMTDQFGVRERFFLLTDKLAEKYRDHPAVIGFDLNEPMAFKPILQYDSELTNAFFNLWQQRIAATERRYITFWGDSPFQFIFINRPPHLDLPEQGNVALDAHFYEPGASGFGRPLFGTSANVNAMLATRAQYNIPVLVGEFGANLKGSQNHLFQYQMDQVLRFFDQHLMSSARWNYTPHWTPERKDNFHDEDFSCFDEARQVRESCAPRASLQRLTGRLIHNNIQHRDEARLFIPLLPQLSRLYRYSETQVDLAWEHDPSQGKTRIFAAQALLFSGENVTIDAQGEQLQCAYDDDQRYVECESPVAGVKRVIIRGEPTS